MEGGKDLPKGLIEYRGKAVDFAFNKYIQGFQKAQELLSDRRFTEDDLINMFILGGKYKMQNPEKFMDKCGEIIESLSQPKSWKVELEMEDLFRANEETYIDDSGVKGNYSTHSKKPKLTNGKIKITKIL